MSTIAEVTAGWTERDVVAGTIVGEASSEFVGGQVAVGCVIRNRVGHARWWGKTWRGVCHQPSQFSCWNDQLRRIADNRAASSSAWLLATTIASDLMADRLPDVTIGCDHYYATTIAPPKWARRSDGSLRTPVLQMGRHLFFRLELPDPLQQAVA